MRYLYPVIVTIASVTLCIHGNDEQICDKPDSFVCSVPGASLGCSIFGFMKRDCPRLCKQCVETTTSSVTTTTPITTMAVVKESSREFSSIVSTLKPSASTTFIVLTNGTTATTPYGKLLSLNSSEVEKGEVNVTTSYPRNYTFTTSTGDHVYLSFALLLFSSLSFFVS
ncbi:hypothetical protein Tcan_13535 [Toxocara canis]|uniref:ShKT domain-containing protein n=1 Tax=Toxocara canis TaxID=6265 RepID=A0A0B2VDC1_TOXCA|nr:hypothetical protein Tcan_13535 [Toxocara canis]